MNTSGCDLTTYALLDSESVGMAFSHIGSLKHYRDNVVRPSIRALSEKIDELDSSEELGAAFLASDLTELIKKTVEGYIIAVQSMWERSLRGMLATCDSRICNGNSSEVLKTAKWGGKPTNIQDHFLGLIGVPIQNFSSYDDLDFLQALGNAIRHGDGRSARRIYQRSPSLWPSWQQSDHVALEKPFRIESVKRKTDNLPFDSITLPPIVLEQMIQSVLWFWEDIENLRCNSFKRKHESVVRKLSTWRSDIDRRDSERFWNLK